jgi:hypothetical protein
MIQRQKVVIQKHSRLMSIDSSINNLGMAIWDMGIKRLLDYRLIHPRVGERGSEYVKSQSMLNQIRELVMENYITHMIMEVPEYWAVGGFEARETGSIGKLLFVCGMIYSLKDQDVGATHIEEFKLVSPRGWKAQLPKEVVANRLQKEYAEKYGIDMQKMNNNVMDGIAIGHFRLFGSV